MTPIYHSFDADGYHTGSAAAPVDPVAGGWAQPSATATTTSPPAYNLGVERARWQNGAWAVETIPEPAPEPAPETIPETLPEPAPPSICSPAQGLVALYSVKGITLDAVDAALAAIPDPVQRYTAQIGFSRAAEWRRGSATMQAMAVLLGLTESDLDALFAYAVGVTL